MRVRWLRTIVPWALLSLFVLAPLYAISIAFAIRTGLFNLSDKAIGKEEYTALWAFLASGFATAATIVGFLITRSNNERSANQLILDTAVKGLELLVMEDGKYAPRAKVAGALATLVHLGHPGIAMRSLRAVWAEGAIDNPTACWLISEVFKGSSAESMLEASVLLREHVRDLCYGDDKKGNFDWPDAVYEQWPLKISYEARYNNFMSLLDLFMSRDKEWWDYRITWGYAMLYLILTRDRIFAAEAATAIRSISPVVDKISAAVDNVDFSYSTRSGSFALSNIPKKASRVKIRHAFLPGISERLTALQTWAMTTDQAEKLSETATAASDPNTVLPAEGGRRPPAGRP